MYFGSDVVKIRKYIIRYSFFVSTLVYCRIVIVVFRIFNVFLYELRPKTYCVKLFIIKKDSFRTLKNYGDERTTLQLKFEKPDRIVLQQKVKAIV